jgi:hypothetical protein
MEFRIVSHHNYLAGTCCKIGSFCINCAGPIPERVQRPFKNDFIRLAENILTVTRRRLFRCYDADISPNPNRVIWGGP